jgi:hypothetical protein
MTLTIADVIAAQTGHDGTAAAPGGPRANGVKLRLRFGLQHTSPWARVAVLTGDQLLAPSPAG